MSQATPTTESIEAEIQVGELAEALAHAKELLAADPTPGVLLLIALLHAQQLDYQAAMETLEIIADQHESWRTLTEEVGLCIDADARRVRRRSDDQVAQERAGIAPPPDFAVWQLGALVRHARDAHEAAAEFVERARSGAPKVSGRVIKADGRVFPFADLRDSDDLTGAMLEGIGSRGLVDVPFSELQTIEFKPIATYHDMLWPVARVMTREGNPVIVRVPALYPESGTHFLKEVRAGRLTLWERDKGYAEAVGLRELALYDEKGEHATIGLYEIARIEFDALQEPDSKE